MSTAPAPPATTRHERIRAVLIWTLAANILLVLAKVVAGVYSNSLAVLAEAAQSSVDALANIVALVMMRVAARAPDPEHPYGHAKFETVSAVGIVAMLSITVFEFGHSAIGRLITGHARPRVTLAVAAVIAGSAAVSWTVSVVEKRYGRRLDSDLLVADAAHTRSDFYAALAVLVGLGFVRLGYPRADALVTLLVAAVVVYAGWQILRSTVPVLVDERAVDEGSIRRIALDTDGVQACYDIRSRGREGNIFAELTIAVSGHLDVEAAHVIADQVETRVTAELGVREVVVHIEPFRRTGP